MFPQLRRNRFCLIKTSIPIVPRFLSATFRARRTPHGAVCIRIRICHSGQTFLRPAACAPTCRRFRGSCSFAKPPRSLTDENTDRANWIERLDTSVACRWSRIRFDRETNDRAAIGLRRLERFLGRSNVDTRILSIKAIGPVPWFAKNVACPRVVPPLASRKF